MSKAEGNMEEKFSDFMFNFDILGLTKKESDSKAKISRTTADNYLKKYQANPMHF